MSVERKHDCPLEGCDRKRARTELLCSPHWFAVPKPLRDEVWRTYKRFGVLSDPYNGAVTAAYASIGFDDDGNRKVEDHDTREILGWGQ